MSWRTILIHSVLRVYNQLISYTWAKTWFSSHCAESRWEGKCHYCHLKVPHIHQHKYIRCHIKSLTKKCEYDTNLVIIILQVGQEIPDLQHPRTSNNRLSIDLFDRNTAHCAEALQRIMSPLWGNDTAVFSSHCVSLLKNLNLDMLRVNYNCTLLSKTYVHNHIQNSAKQTCPRTAPISTHIHQSLPSSLTCYPTLSSCLAEHV